MRLSRSSVLFTNYLANYCIIIMMVSLKLSYASYNVEERESGNCSGNLRTITAANNSNTDGEDCKKCLTGSNNYCNCTTIDNILLHLPSCSEVFIETNQLVNMTHIINNAHNVIITANDNVDISINGNITFIDCTDIHIRDMKIIVDDIISWSDIHPNPARFDPYQYSISEQGSLAFVNSSCVSVSHCHFESLRKRERALMFFNLTGENVIDSSVFNGNSISGGIVIYQNNYSANVIISGCDFFDNKAPHGGALQILIFGDSPSNQIMIENTLFEDNCVDFYGGHVDIILKGNVESTAIVFTDTNFTLGQAQFGGVASINVNLSSNTVQSPSIIHFRHCIFDNNTSDQSGVLEYIQYDVQDDIFVMFDGCLFINNTANIASTIHAVVDLSYDDSDTLNTDLDNNLNNKMTLIFEDCKWYHNKPPKHSVGRHNHFGNIYTLQVPLHFNGTTIISDTHGPTIMLINTLVTFAGTVLIQHCGKPILGCGLFIDGQSLINLREGVNVTFNGAEATYGGTIYSEFSVQENTKRRIPKPCIFIYEGNQRNSDVSKWNASVSFNDTKSFVSGDAMYLRNNVICSRSVIEKMFFNNSVFSGLNPSSISSPAASMNYTNPGIERYNFERKEDRHAQFRIMLGQTLKFNATLLDTMNNPTLSIVIASLQCSKAQFKFPAAFTFYKGVHLTNAYLVGPKVLSNYTCTMKLQTYSQPIQLFEISLNIVECYLGFVHDDDGKKCTCDPSYTNNDAFACNIINGTVCIKNGYWYGVIGIEYTLDQCFECNNNNGSEICKEGYHELPLLISDQDRQCRYNRGGTLCLLCNNDSTYTYDAVRCVPKKMCQPWHVPLLVILYLCTWTVIITVFFISLKVDFHIGTGYLYGILNYFTVILNIVNDYRPLGIITDVIASVLQLNPSPLGYLPLCSILKMNRLEHMFIHYINPLVMFIALFAIVKLAQRFKRFSLPHRSPAHGFCTIILLSFMSLNETSLNMLRGYRYNSYGSDSYVYIQPDVHYFDPRKHAPFVVMAILAEILFLVPFTLLLLFTPLLSKWINFIRIKPILDNFQYCFKDNMRWMAGFYFTGRLLFFLLSVINPINRVPIFDISLLLNLLMLSFMSIAQPYKKQHLNYIDSLLLLNITVSEYLIKVLYTTPPDSTTYLKIVEVITYVLVISAIIYALVVFIGGIRQSLVKYNITVSCCKLRRARQIKMIGNIENNEEQEVIIGEDKVRMFYPKRFRDSIFENISDDEDEIEPLTASGQLFLFEGLKKVFRARLISAEDRHKSYTSTDVSVND